MHTAADLEIGQGGGHILWSVPSGVQTPWREPLLGSGTKPQNLSYFDFHCEILLIEDLVKRTLNVRYKKRALSSETVTWLVFLPKPEMVRLRITIEAGIRRRQTDGVHSR